MLVDNTFIILPDTKYGLNMHLFHKQNQYIGNIEHIHLDFTVLYVGEHDLVTFRDLIAEHVAMLIQLQLDIYRFICKKSKDCYSK